MPRKLDKGKSQIEDTHPSSSRKVRDFTKPVEEKKKQEKDALIEGNSSEHAKMSILENFTQIGGNSDLSNAKIIFIAEAHSYNNLKDNLELLEKCASRNDILLVEGYASMEPVAIKDWIKGECNTYRGDILTLTKQLRVYGWDNMRANHKAQRLYSLENRFSKEIEETLNTLDIGNLYRLNTHIENVQTHMKDCRNERDKSLITTIDHTLTTFQNKGKILL